MSHYRSVSVQLRASANGERVRIGIKDRSQLDNGGEITVEETLTTRWSTIALPLNAVSRTPARRDGHDNAEEERDNAADPCRLRQGVRPPLVAELVLGDDPKDDCGR